MALFADRMPDAEMLALLGDDIIYTPAGKPPVAIKGIFEPNSARVGVEAYVTELQTEIEFLKSDINYYPQRGDRIAVGNNHYKVDSVVADDGVYVRVAVSK